MEVRPCDVGDLDALDQALPLGGPYGHRYRLDAQEQGRWLYLLALDPMPVGGCLVQWQGAVNDQVRRQLPDAVEISNLYVAADARGRGAGRMLIAEAERQAVERRRAIIGVGVADDNHQARRLYERLGYSPSDARYAVDYDYVDDDGAERHVFEEGDFLVKPLGGIGQTGRLTTNMPKRYHEAAARPVAVDPANDAGAVPGVNPSAGAKGAFRFNIEVDGQQFAVYEARGGWSYEWLTGPNPGYGFGSFGPPINSTDEHRDNIRHFLRDIDPTTGFMRD